MRAIENEYKVKRECIDNFEVHTISYIDFVCRINAILKICDDKQKKIRKPLKKMYDCIQE